MKKTWGILSVACLSGLFIPATSSPAALNSGSLTDYIPSIVYNSEDGSLTIDTGYGYGGPNVIYNVIVWSDYGIFDPYRASSNVSYATEYYVETMFGLPLYPGDEIGEPDFMYDHEIESFLLDDLTFAFQYDPYDGTLYAGDMVYYTPVIDIPGDQNGDGFVGLDDLDIVLNAWNMSVPPADSRADANGDGYVGLDDLDIVLNNWNAGTPPSLAVPEPASAAVLLLMMGAAGLRRFTR